MFLKHLNFLLIGFLSPFYRKWTTVVIFIGRQNILQNRDVADKTKRNLETRLIILSSKLTSSVYDSEIIQFM